MNKYLIVRFSSFGDIAQALPCVTALHQFDPSADIHWLTRADFQEFVSLQPNLKKVWTLQREKGFAGLLRLIRELRQERFTHLYDAHSNLRSFFIRSLLRLAQPRLRIVRRPKDRWKRFLLFRFRVNLFEKPFRGVLSFLKPLQRWWPIDVTLPKGFQLRSARLPTTWPADVRPEDTTVLAPSAAWELKRWPVEHWIELTQLAPHRRFVLLAGPEDTFCAEIVEKSPGNVIDMRGRLSWTESVAILERAGAVISGDTGLLHVADILGKPTIAILGPTAFGHPVRATTQVAEIDLYCRPCTKDGRGRCYNPEFKKCLRDISPLSVVRRLDFL